MKVCLISTVGGHLTQLETVAESVRGHDMYLLTVPSPSGLHAFPGVRRYEVRQILRNPVNALLNAVQSLRIYLKERPNVVITTGAGDAAPTVLIAAALGSAVIFVESFARVERPSLFGRLFHRWCDTVLFQWPGLRHAYRRGIHVAPLFRPASGRQEIPATPTILVLTGTHTLGFERLLRAVDELVASRSIPGRVIAQIGHSRYEPRNVEHFRFLPHDELTRTLDGADVVVTHDGSASIGESLSKGRPTIVVPRRPSEGEVSYRSDQGLARHLAKIGLVVLAEDPRELPRALDRLRSLTPGTFDTTARPVGDVIRAFLAGRA
ncbi:MAG TPA: glycosyltransferase, partial [Thermoplasmata archaeon]